MSSRYTRWVMDGCFQVVGMARNMTGSLDEPTYLPFGWERLWLAGETAGQGLSAMCK